MDKVGEGRHTNIIGALQVVEREHTVADLVIDVKKIAKGVD